MYEIECTVFDDERKRLLSVLQETEPGTTEYSTILSGVKALELLKMQESKIQTDAAREYMNKLKMETEQKIQELETEMKDRHHQDDTRVQEERNANDLRIARIRLCVEIVGIILPIVFCWIWMGRGFAFEQTGVFVSNTFRSLWNSFPRMMR